MLRQKIQELSNYDKTKADKHGEVFTPFKLIDEMLESLPTEIWGDSSLTFLDPCAGKGQFPAVIVERLMAGLAEQMPDEEQRMKHILENQLFMCEYQEESAKQIEELFNPEGKYSLNIHAGDYLQYETKQHDYVVMNPPYNPKSVWKKFVEKGLKDSTEGLLAIHPAGWRESTNHKKLRAQLVKHIVELHINDFEAFRDDAIAITTDWYFYKHGYEGPQMVFYSNGHRELVDVRNIKWLTRFPPSSPAYTILMKILGEKPNGGHFNLHGFTQREYTFVDKGELYRTNVQPLQPPTEILKALPVEGEMHQEEHAFNQKDYTFVEGQDLYRTNVQPLHPPMEILNEIGEAKPHHKFHTGEDKQYEFKPEGPYRQCGGPGSGTKWTEGKFHYTTTPTPHQFEAKVVMAYAGKPRARYFSKEEATGVIRGIYWLTNNKNLVTLLNSKMLWKILLSYKGPINGEYKQQIDPNVWAPWGSFPHHPKDVLKAIPAKTAPIIKTVPFEERDYVFVEPDTLYKPFGEPFSHDPQLLKNLEISEASRMMTEEDLYKHYGLTEEELKWINE